LTRRSEADADAHVRHEVQPARARAERDDATELDVRRDPVVQPDVDEVRPHVDILTAREEAEVFDVREQTFERDRRVLEHRGGAQSA
jgi:hypothetical protein